ncbi:MAG: methyltransferase, partial [Coriobacteriales bacterium]|nr:methyltransferase [Coriobacteriales bacterium]
MAVSPNIDRELEALAAAGAVILRSQEQRGRWREQHGSHFARVHLDYGCGMGDYCVGAAAQNPSTLYIGLDVELFCVAKAARKALDAGVPNTLFAAVPRDSGAAELSRFFAPAELDSISINFPTPHARAAQASQRMTHASALMAYRELLTPGGNLDFKTDSQPLWDYSLIQFELAGYAITWRSDSEDKRRAPSPITGYERRLAAQGARIIELEARPLAPASDPASIQQTAPQSLYEYLPQD